MARAYALGTPIRVLLAKAPDARGGPRAYVYDGLYKIVECHKCDDPPLHPPPPFPTQRRLPPPAHMPSCAKVHLLHVHSGLLVPAKLLIAESHVPTLKPCLRLLLVRRTTESFRARSQRWDILCAGAL